MKNILLLVLMAAFSSATYAQNMTVKLKNGTTQSFKVSDIEKMTWEESVQSFTINVSTQDTYNTFSCTSGISNQILGQDKFYLGVYTYIYDADGNLVYSDKTYSKTLDEVSFSVPGLAYGTYTVVTTEMVVSKDDNYQSPAFEMVDTEKLSTVTVGYRKYTNTNGSTYHETFSYWYQAVGSSAEKITVDANTSKISVAPKGLGCIVDCNYYNYNNSTDKNVLLLSTKNCPIGRKLNPALSGSDRFVYESYNEGSNAEIRGWTYTSSKFAEEVSFDAYLLEEGSDLDCGIGAGKLNTTTGSISWSSVKRNEFLDGHMYYGGLYYVNGATDLYGGIFDNITDYNTWLANVPTTPTPEPETDALTVPNTTWGSTVSAVQSSMKGYTMTKGNSGSAVYDSDYGYYYIQYNGKDNESLILYSFTSATTGLYESDVYYETSSVTCAELKEMLSKQYTYVTETSSAYAYMTSDAKTIIILYDFSDFGLCCVSYADASKNSRVKEQNMELVARKSAALQTNLVLNSKKDTTKYVYSTENALVLKQNKDNFIRLK